MDPKKFTSYIHGCNANFIETDTRLYESKVTYDRGKDEYALVPSKYTGYVTPGQLVGQTNVVHQLLVLDIPKEIYDQGNIECIYVKQFPDSGIKVVAEHDVKSGDTATRLLLPNRYFHYMVERGNYDHRPEKRKEALAEVASVALDLYVGIGIFIRY